MIAPNASLPPDLQVKYSLTTKLGLPSNPLSGKPGPIHTNRRAVTPYRPVPIVIHTGPSQMLTTFSPMVT
jgi:hypothetical protein